MSYGSLLRQGLLASAGVCAVSLALWIGSGVQVQAKTSTPTLRVAVTPSRVVVGTQAELLAQLVPPRSVAKPRVVATVLLPDGTRKPVSLVAVSNQPGLWEGLAPGGTVGTYAVSWALTGKGGTPVLTRISRYTVVQGTALDRSGRLIGFVVIVGAAWFLLRRRRYSR